MPTARRTASAFTLVELVIAVALAVLLMIGVNLVFRFTSDAVSAGQTVSANLRSAQAAGTTFQNDLAALAPDGPALILRNRRTAAFRNAADAATDRDYPADQLGTHGDVDRALRTIDADQDGDEQPNSPDEIPRALLGQRNFRVDQLHFFARGRFPRQTGNEGELAANMTLDEAWIAIGHLRLPGAGGAYDPGFWTSAGTVTTAAANSGNFYASQFTLGRSAVLLQAPDANNQILNINDLNNPQWFYGRDPTAAPDARQPLTRGTRAYNGLVGTGSNSFDLQDSRYDLAGTSIRDYTWILRRSIVAATGTPTWSQLWFNELGDWRFDGSVRPLTPLSSDVAARTVPVLIEHCSGFIVEFAGDFVTQISDPFDANYGDVTAAAPDGTLDFVVPQSGPQQDIRQTRWYGLPRDTDGDGAIPGYQAGRRNNQMPDVVPLRDVIYSFDPTPGNYPYLFERNIVSVASNTPVLNPKIDYASVAPGTGVNTGLALDDEYVCAWGVDNVDDPRPWMLRILITIDDTEARLPQGQTFEYVLPVR